VAAFATVLAVMAVRWLAFLANLESIAADVRVAVMQPPMPPQKDIVIAAITEETLAGFQYRSPVDRGFLADLLRTLERKGARQIGLDVLFDQPTEPAKDEALRRALRELRVPVTVSYTVTPTIVNEEQLEYLDAFVPEALRGAANLATDPFDGAVRWIFPGENIPGMPMSLPRRIAAHAGIATPASQPEIAWRPRPDVETPAFPIYPSHAVAALPDAWFRDRIVLIGAVLSITDRHRTPFAVVGDGDDAQMPGILVQAHATSQLLEGRRSPKPGTGAVVLMTALLALTGVAIGLLKRGIAVNVVVGAVLVTGLWVGAILGFRHGVPLVPLVAPTLALALALWMMDAVIGRGERKQRQFVQSAFSRYVSPAVVDQLVDDPQSLRVTGERRQATFVFTDIAGFTTLSEELAGERLSEVLNAYLDGACEIVLRHEGTIDKFIGDAIMAIFNAPLAQPDHAQRAVRCALELDAYAEAFRARMNAEGVRLGITRIGVHTGPATIGNFGSQQRMDFTALGDTVNTAARCEGVNKYFGTRVCCTHDVVTQCEGLAFAPIGDIVLKGKKVPVRLYCPLDAEQAASPAMRDYLAAFAQIERGEPEGCRQMVALHTDRPGDPLPAFHADRIAHGHDSVLIVMDDK
jgi:adenylate cyclase